MPRAVRTHWTRADAIIGTTQSLWRFGFSAQHSRKRFAQSGPFCAIPCAPVAAADLVTGTDSADHEAMRERIALVDEDGVVAGHPSPAANRWNDGRLAGDAGFVLDPALE